MNKPARTSTPTEISLINDYSWQPQRYSQWYPALPIPGSRLNSRNAPGARPCINRQPLKKFHELNEPWKFNTTKFFYANCFWSENFPIYGRCSSPSHFNKTRQASFVVSHQPLVWKALMRVEVAGLRGHGSWCKKNKSSFKKERWEPGNKTSYLHANC